MKTFLFTLLTVFSLNAFACIAFYTSESVSGLNKICYYNHLGSTVALTVSNTTICPINIQWRH